MEGQGDRKLKTYEVLGDRDILGHPPGDTFKADIPKAQERRLIERKQLRVKKTPSKDGGTRSSGRRKGKE